MNSFLLNRQLGSVSPQAFAAAQNNRLLRSLQYDKDVKFVLEAPESSTHSGTEQNGNSNKPLKAHEAGVNSIAIDRFEGR